MTNSFYPDSYEVPQSNGNYMKFQQGENRFRIMSKPLIGVEYWVDADGTPRERGAQPQNGDKPVRVQPNQKIPNGANAKFFNIFVVFNRQLKELQILEITQTSILNSLLVYVKDEDWGDPRAYDLVVTRKGEKLDTEYTLIAKPKTELDEGIIQLYKDAKINLEVLFTGGDPFKSDADQEQQEVEAIASKVSKKVNEQVDPDDIPF